MRLIDFSAGRRLDWNTNYLHIVNEIEKENIKRQKEKDKRGFLKRNILWRCKDAADNESNLDVRMFFFPLLKEALFFEIVCQILPRDNLPFPT